MKLQIVFGKLTLIFGSPGKHLIVVVVASGPGVIYMFYITSLVFCEFVFIKKCSRSGEA